MPRPRSGLVFRVAILVSLTSLFSLWFMPALEASNSNLQDGARNSSVRAKRPAKARSPQSGSDSPMLDMLSAVGPFTTSRILASADFDLLGLAVTATPATQTVPKNTPTAVLTSVQTPPGVDPAAIIAGLNPAFRVRGELAGPSLPGPIQLEAKIGDPLSIPALTSSGDHVVRNLRVVDTATAGAPTIAPVSPDSCGIAVIDQLLISQVNVREMTYDEILSSGIAINDDSYRFFNFVLGLTTSSGVQTLVTPIAFPRPGVIAPPVVAPPRQSLPVGVRVPEVFPIMLSALEDDGGGGGNPLKLPDGGEARIPGVVVFPGRVGFLNQFFEAIVIVANGAPNGTPLVLRNLKARVALPDNGTPLIASDDPLRVATTQTGGAVSQLDLHGLGPDGKYGTADDTTSFSPGQSGQATFLLEGLKEGLHTATFKLEATLEGLPTGPVAVMGEIPGAVLVRDASFAVTFTHPAIVRAGQEYDLALTLYNSGSRDILGAVAQLNANSISGAELLSGDNGQRAFDTTVIRKQSSTVVWRLKANVTGQVTASYVKVGEGIESGLRLVTGVGDRNVPLSPDSLILPDAVKYLPPGIIEPARGLLGQAWSIATAPAGSLPQGVVSVSRETVFARAHELGNAGIRVAFNEPTHVSLQTGLRDWLGELQETPDAGFGDAQRNTPAGYRWFDSIGTTIFERLTTGQPTLTPQTFHQDLANAEAPRSAFVSALVTQTSGPATFGAKLTDPTNHRTGFGASASDRFGDLGTGASIRLVNADASSTIGQLLLVSRPADGQWTFELTGWQAGTADVSLLVRTTGRTFRQIIFTGINLSPGSRHRIVFRPGTTAAPVLESFQGSAFQPTSASPSISTINEPAPGLVGAVQVSPDLIQGGDKYGRLVGLLFSKPMLESSVESISRYRIAGGELIGSNPSQIVGREVKVTKAAIDLGDRFVFLALDSPIGPYVRRDVTITGVTDVRGAEIVPSVTNSLITPKVSPQGQPPGAYLTGRLLNGDGTPVAGAIIELLNSTCNGTTDLVSVQTADSQGRFAFDYTRNGDCGGPIILGTHPTTGSKKRISTPVLFDGQHMVIDLVYLARGNVRGTVSIGGVPAPNAFVRIMPSLDSSQSTVVRADAVGRYQASDIPVGPLGISAVGSGTQSTATGLAAGSIDAPGATAVVDVTLQSITGVVRGRVLNADSTPAVGSLVVAYSLLPGANATPQGTPVGFAFTEPDGSFSITRLPLQDVRLEVTDALTGLRSLTTAQLSPGTPEVSGIIITLSGFGSISGRVVDETGGFVGGAVVTGGSAAVQADPLGFFTLPRVRAGNVTIHATDNLTGASGNTPVTVRIGETTSNVQIVCDTTRYDCG